MTTTTRAIAAMRARVEAATEGPWRTAYAYKKERWGPLVAATAPGHQVHAVGHTGGTYPSNDLDFIASARTDVPMLLDIADAAAAYVEGGAIHNDERPQSQTYARLIETLHALAALAAEEGT